MSLSMYQASVPVFARYLAQLDGLVLRASQAAAADLPGARLAPSMLPLAVQIEIAANFALRACAPLAGLAMPPYGDYAQDWPGLRQRIAAAQTFLAGLVPAQMEGSEERLISDGAGQATVTLPGRVFLLEYALPNFFFHLTTTYAILRMAGVDLGKADFDGYHRYD